MELHPTTAYAYSCQLRVALLHTQTQSPVSCQAIALPLPCRRAFTAVSVLSRPGPSAPSIARDIGRDDCREAALLGQPRTDVYSRRFREPLTGTANSGYVTFGRGWRNADGCRRARCRSIYVERTGRTGSRLCPRPQG